MVNDEQNKDRAGGSEPDFSEHEVEVKDHYDYDVKTVCAYCGKEFEIDENVIEKTIHGRTWRFCSEACLTDFNDAIDYRDDAYDEEDADAPRDQHS